MKCHYKVLEVEMNADEAQIKTAYRKLALKWHPDKNLDNSEYAKEQFLYVQQAYEVLSDRQERAWYDKHREQILRGKDYEDTALDVFQYFTTTCFQGYGDDDNGFYTVYRQVFEQIIAEDLEHMEVEEDSVDAPTFGYSNSDYDEVVGPFYAFWSSYNTKRSYAWLNLHNVQETRDRRIFKLMEKENKKIRLKAKKERNEEVRALVAFVRKRDKRVQENSKRLEAKIIENRQKQEEMSRQKRLERQKELTATQPLPEWTKLVNVEKQLQGIEKGVAEAFGEELSSDESCESADGFDNLYCIACNKVFKTSKGYENHELSKKHKQNVKLLKVSMLTEEKTENAYDDVESLISDGCENGTIDSLEGSNEKSEEEIDRKKLNRKKKVKKPKNVIQVEEDDGGNISVHNDLLIDDNKAGTSSSFNDIKKKQKRKSKNANSKVNQNIKKPSDSDIVTENQTTQESDCCNNTQIDKTSEKEEKGKLKQRNNKQGDKTSMSNIDTAHACVTCKAEFPSKNKLFDHLKKSKHSVLIPSSNVIPKKKANKK